MQTSNCDQLHATAAGWSSFTSDEKTVPPLLEIHGSLGWLQCASPELCTDELTPVTDIFLQNLERDDWQVPRCPKCPWCLRPNVRIFGDVVTYSHRRHETQSQGLQRWKGRFVAGGEEGRVVDGEDGPGASSDETRTKLNIVVLEIGAGVVVPSIR